MWEVVSAAEGELVNSSGLAISVLGPLEVRHGGTLLELPAGRLRSLLAVLALSVGQPLPVEHLARALWGHDEPVNVRRSVQTHLTRLRGVLGPGTVRTMPGGYQLDINPDSVDALRFRALLAEARRARDTAAEYPLLRRALQLWRGLPFQGIDARDQWAAESAYLLESYLSAVERRIDLDLAKGRHAEVIAELKELVVRHPLREPLWARLLVALWHCGRRAEALAHYQQLRMRLAEELGTEPGVQIRQIHTRLLRTDTPPPPSERPSGPSPPSTKVFIGHLIDLPPARPAPDEPNNARRAGTGPVRDPAAADRSVAILVWTPA